MHGNRRVCYYSLLIYVVPAVAAVSPSSSSPSTNELDCYIQFMADSNIASSMDIDEAAIDEGLYSRQL